MSKKSIHDVFDMDLDGIPDIDLDSIPDLDLDGLPELDSLADLDEKDDNSDIFWMILDNIR